MLKRYAVEYAIAGIMGTKMTSCFLDETQTSKDFPTMIAIRELGSVRSSDRITVIGFWQLRSDQ